MFSSSIFEIVTTVVLSIVVIIGFQYIWNYLKNTYTKKITKNLVDTQIQKYKRIIDEIQQNNIDTDTGSQPSGFISEKEKQIMNEELMKFILQ